MVGIHTTVDGLKPSETSRPRGTTARRYAFRTVQILIDLAGLGFAYFAAFLLRFDGQLPFQMVKRLAFTLPYVILFQYAILVLFGVPKFVWRYVSLREFFRIVLAIGTGSAVLLLVRIVAGVLRETYAYAQYALVPIGVIVIDFAIATAAIVGVRTLRRFVAERSVARSMLGHGPEAKRTLLVGAGQAGAMVARELKQHPDTGILPIGFVDDDPTKRGLVVQGLSVLGSTEQLRQIARRKNAKQVLITMSGATGDAIRRIVGICDQTSLPVRIIPGIFEILDGTVNLTRIREVSIEDLLGREPIQLEEDLIARFLRGKRVMVTGAGGSIGMELCRQIACYEPSSLTLVERAEFHLFTIHQELTKNYADLTILPRLCDVNDTQRLNSVFAMDRPQVVFHAAAHKHVPMVEWNPGEAVANNVFGTKNVADAAQKHECEAFVLISTDKAVNPTSIMGATKRIAEMYVQSLSGASATKYVAVRFGNVLGSAGSVIPVFQDQIAAGGPVTVTHPDMKRYFMTIPEASQLVMQAAAMGRGGEIFVLDMGTPVNISDLAKDLIRLSGLEPGKDIEIVYTGIRPGEKLFEELGFDAEKMDKTRHPKVFIGKLSPYRVSELAFMIERLRNVTSSMNTAVVRDVLMTVVPEMQPDATHTVD